MNQVYFERWTELAKKAQTPFQALAELNIKTLQEMSYIKPEEMAQVKKPEEFFEQQIRVAVDNGHRALDYMQKFSQIMENAMLSAVQEVKEKSNASHTGSLRMNDGEMKAEGKVSVKK